MLKVSESQSREDRLAERLKRLRAGAVAPSKSSGGSKDTAESLAAQVKDEVKRGA